MNKSVNKCVWEGQVNFVKVCVALCVSILSYFCTVHVIVDDGYMQLLFIGVNSTSETGPKLFLTNDALEDRERQACSKMKDIYTK